MRTCRDCGSIKDNSEFVQNKQSRDGVDTLCLVCNRKRVKARRATGLYSRTEEHRRYRAKYPHKRRAIAAKRRATKLNATPIWANLENIKEFYMEADYQQMHVDHIVPLINPKVCGLHWEGNLQLLTAADNLAKSNKLIPEMIK